MSGTTKISNYGSYHVIKMGKTPDDQNGFSDSFKIM